MSRGFVSLVGAGRWRAIIEKPILDGLGQVDVALEREGLTGACEIAVSSTVDQEVMNIRKCLAAGFNHVAAITVHSQKRRQLGDYVRTIDEKQQVQVVSVEELFDWLNKFSAITAPQTHAIRGYRVDVRTDASMVNVQARATLAKVVARALSRLKE